MLRLAIMLLLFTAVLTSLTPVSVAVKIEEIADTNPPPAEDESMLTRSKLVRFKPYFEADDVTLNLDVPEFHEISLEGMTASEDDPTELDDDFDLSSLSTCSILKALWMMVAPWLVTPSGVVIFTALASAASALLALGGVPLPGSVAMLLLLSFILFVGPEQKMNSVAAFLNSGSVLLRTWQSVMLSTALVSLPLSVKDFTLFQGLGLGGIQIVEWTSVLLQAGFTTMLFQRIHRRFWPASYAKLPAPTPVAPSSGPKPLLLPPWLLTTTTVGALVSMVPFFALEGEGRWTAFCVMTGLAIPSFHCLSQIIRNYFPRFPVPATVVTAAFAMTLNFVLTASIDESYEKLFGVYSTDSRINMFTGITGSIGPANLYLFFVNSAIVAMTLPIFSSKKELMSNGISLGINSCITMARAMLTPVLLAKACKLSSMIARTLSMRTASAAVAMASIRFVDGDVPLAGSIGVITGAIGAVAGIPLMNLLGWKDSMIRGIAMGASSSGLGTAVILVEEPESAVWAVVGYISVSLWGSIFILIPPSRELIRYFADM